MELKPVGSGDLLGIFIFVPDGITAHPWKCIWVGFIPIIEKW